MARYVLETFRWGLAAGVSHIIYELDGDTAFTLCKEIKRVSKVTRGSIRATKSPCRECVRESRERLRSKST